MMDQAKGRTIQPLISEGKTEVPPAYAEPVRTPTTRNEQLDEILVGMVDERGTRWKIISRLMGDFTESECKNQWLFLISSGRTFAPN
jgi:hypothetical protein